LVSFLLGACSSLRKPEVDGPPVVAEQPVKDLPENPVPRHEPLSKYGNPPSYVVFGKTYRTLKSSHGFVQRGIASWYGKKFHGRRTSSGEPYDMYGMTAAHKQLPLPTYVQVTNLKNGKQVVLRVNDRGPFHGNRIIDLSYTAAKKLDIVKEGTGLVEVRALDPSNYTPNHANRDANHELTDAVGLADADIGVESDTEVSEVLLETMSEAGLEQGAEESISANENLVQPIGEEGPQVFIQVGAFEDHENATQLKNQLSTLDLGQVAISSITKNAKQLHRVRIGPLATVQSADDTVAELNSMGMSDHRVVID